jgi:23S rRNA (guanosine2251-2'-O)-methyltransferase
MRARSFQFRLCINPGCGLRYPLIDLNQFGDRCPVCLGETIAVAEGVLNGEPHERPPEPSSKYVEALLDNVRSAWNVGSIFRSAEGFGMHHLYLCGITATPDNERVRKTALGAESTVPWSAHKNGVAQIRDLKSRGHTVWALEHTRRSVSLDAVAHDGPGSGILVLVVGSEQAGIDPGILELCDQVAHLEMHGRKESFNVAVAFAVAAHALCLNA